MESYLYSALRREKRGLLASKLRLHQVKKAQVNRESININYIRCMLCGVKCQSEVLHLHEIVARGLIGNKEALEYLPVELHALLCPPCNMERADHQVSRRKLLQYSIEMWGMEQVRCAVDNFNVYLMSVGGMPLSSLVIDYTLFERDE